MRSAQIKPSRDLTCNKDSNRASQSNIHGKWKSPVPHTRCMNTPSCPMNVLPHPRGGWNLSILSFAKAGNHCRSDPVRVQSTHEWFTPKLLLPNNAELKPCGHASVSRNCDVGRTAFRHFRKLRGLRSWVNFKYTCAIETVYALWQKSFWKFSLKPKSQDEQGRTNQRNTGKTSVDRSTKTTLTLTIPGCN